MIPACFSSPTKKWACAHWCVSPNAGKYTTVLSYSLYAGGGEKDKRRRERGFGLNMVFLCEPEPAGNLRRLKDDPMLFVERQ